MFRLTSFRNKLGNRLFKNYLTNQKRFINIHEYQSMNLFNDYNITTPKYKVCTSIDDINNPIDEFNSKDIVVKAQVLAGGRGKGHWKNGSVSGGGVKMATNISQIKQYTNEMLGNYLITKQTDENGRICNTVLLTERLYLRRETYFSILLDRESGGPVLVGSPAGGMNIEEVAMETPELVFKEPIDIYEGINDEIVSYFFLYF